MALQVLEKVLRAKVSNEEVKNELLSTENKTIVMIDRNKWLGMRSGSYISIILLSCCCSAAGGIPTGKNEYGKCLMAIREQVGPDKRPRIHLELQERAP